MKRLIAVLLFCLFCLTGTAESYAYNTKAMEEAFGIKGGSWTPGTGIDTSKLPGLDPNGGGTNAPGPGLGNYKNQEEN